MFLTIPRCCCGWPGIHCENQWLRPGWGWAVARLPGALVSGGRGQLNTLGFVSKQEGRTVVGPTVFAVLIASENLW